MPIPKIVITAALTLANMALTMTRKIEGPRLDDLKFTGGDYGGPLPLVWGMRRLPAQVIWAEDLREVKRRRKTKGGKYNDYSYYGTWAVALAGHEIAAVRRIWFDTHLVYDLSGAGPVTPFDFGSSGTIEDFIAIYLGTETQEPDPRIEAWCNERYGEDSAPAYRGTAYIVFKDLPLEKLGNRIPQVSAEILSAQTASYPKETLTATYMTTTVDSVFFDNHTMLFHKSSDGAGGHHFTVIDLAARAEVLTVIADRALEGGIAVEQDGSILAIQDARRYLLRYPLGSTAPAVVHDFGAGSDDRPASPPFAFVDGNGDEHWFTNPAFGSGDNFLDGAATDMAALTGYDFDASHVFNDLDGDTWVVGEDGSDLIFYRIVTIVGSGPALVVASGLTVSGATACHYRDAEFDQFVVLTNGDLHAIDRATGAVLASNTTLTANATAMRGLVPGATSVWMYRNTHVDEISLADLTVLRSIAFTAWTGSVASCLYDPVGHALICDDTSGPTLSWRYLDRVGPGAVTLATICEDVAGWCGADDHNFSDLDQEVTGWSATRGPASAILEPLLDAYDADLRPHDFTIEGLKRTGVAAGSTLATEWFTGEPRYSVQVRQASELPHAVLFDFADVDADQQPNTARADRPLDATDARSEQKIDLTTLALDADEARQLADRYFRRIWNERKQVGLSLTARVLALEPGDVRTLELDGEEFDARCVRLTVRADDVLATEWRLDHPGLATLNGGNGASFDGRDEQVVVVPLTSKGFVLDVPLLIDSDEASVPQLYTLAAPYADGTWPGAVIYQAVDGEYSEELASVPSSSSATWGYAEEAMAYVNPNLWDRSTVLTVTLQTGELAGCTEAAANANPLLNLAAIGAPGRWEIVQFTTATLGAGTTYTVSGFKRGRRGTEWAAELHAAGDEFVLLDTAEAQAMGLSEVGDTLSFKAITAGRTTGFPIPVEPYTGATMKPYAPCQLEAVKDAGSGDWSISWVRRTRVGGAWTSGTSIALSETSEEYEVEILDGVDVVRTFTATDITENGDGGSVVYEAADQTTDFGGEVAAGDLDFKVYQISADVDRGFAAVGAA